MIRYQFCNEVFLTYDNQGYHILIGNKKTDESSLTAEQLKNPLLAQQRFLNVISSYFYPKISKYIIKTGRKKGLGCTSRYDDCEACIKAGFNTQNGSECYISPESSKTILERINDNDCCRPDNFQKS